MKNVSLFLGVVSFVMLQYNTKGQNFERIDPYRHAKENINFLSDANGKPFKSQRNFEEEAHLIFQKII